MMNHELGIIQGRLSPPVDGRIQAFPASSWKQEFERAAALHLDGIEWIFEEPHKDNPLWQEVGRENIRKVVKETGVAVHQVCADYFMEHPFFRVSDPDARLSVEVLKSLIPICKDIGASSIEIPLLDNSQIKTDEELQTIVQIMKDILPEAEKNNMVISLEASLPPKQFAALMTELSHPLFSIVYDTGNSSSLGYDTEEEVQLLGTYFSNVHIKDRVKGGGTVPLGEGDAQFDKTFAALKALRYAGPITLQAARGETGQEMATVQRYLEFVKKYLAE